MKDQKKAGIVISYFNLIINMCISVFFTPFLISSLGQAEYGVYRVVQSFAGQLSIMTFGMSTLVTRNIIYYNVKKEPKEKENFLAMALAISVILSLAVLIIGAGMYNAAGEIFKNSLKAEEIETAKKLIFFFILNISCIVLSDCFAGISGGYERFAVSNGIKTIRLILRVITLIVLLKLGFKSIAIVFTDFLLSAMVLIFEAFYGLVILKEKIRFHYFDSKLFKSSILFSLAILLQAVINQVNQNLDSLILGIMTDSSTVAVYSVALVIYTTYNSVTTVVSTVFKPKAINMVVKGCSDEEMTSLVSSVGRYQLMFIGSVLVGFTLFGKEFLCLWLDESYLPVYKITLILIIPVTVPLIQNVCISILDAKLKRMARSVILGLLAVINCVVSIILIKKIGYIGAAYGTSIATIIGHVILMNIYYQKVIHLNVIKMFSDIFKGILPSMLVILLICIPINYINIQSSLWLSFICKICIFIFVYCIIMYLFGANKAEKQFFKNQLNKIKFRKKYF